MNRTIGSFTSYFVFCLCLLLLVLPTGCGDGGSGSSGDASYSCGLKKTGTYPLRGHSYGLAVSENTAVIMNEAEIGGPAALHVVDIRRPSKPVRSAVRSFPDNTLVNAITLSGRGAYLLLRQYNAASAVWKSTLAMLDLSDNRLPMKMLTTVADGYANDFVLSENRGYLLGDAGVAVVNMATMATTPVAGSSSCCFMRMEGNRAYTSGGLKALEVFSLETPGRPVLLGSFDIPEGLDGYAHDLAVAGNTAVLAWGGSGVVVLDISRPEQISHLAGYATNDWAEGIAVDANAAYLADGESGLVVVNRPVSRSAEPAEICQLDGYAADVIVSGSHVFVSVNDKGFVIYEAAAKVNR